MTHRLWCCSFALCRICYMVGCLAQLMDLNNRTTSILPDTQTRQKKLVTRCILFLWMFSSGRGDSFTVHSLYTDTTYCKHKYIWKSNLYRNPKFGRGADPGHKNSANHYATVGHVGSSVINFVWSNWHIEKDKPLTWEQKQDLIS